jgi:hypothetical protein
MMRVSPFLVSRPMLTASPARSPWFALCLLIALFAFAAGWGVAVYLEPPMPKAPSGQVLDEGPSITITTAARNGGRP